MKKNMAIVGLLALSIGVVFQLKRIRSEPQPEEDRVPEPTAVAAPMPRLLDLGAGKCVPCKAMAPILDEMSETFAGQLEVEFIDVWQDEAAGERYGIRMIPTQIFFDAEGNELFRHEGFYAREAMLAKWQELGHIFTEAE